jgi:hypothetical protein
VISPAQTQLQTPKEIQQIRNVIIGTRKHIGASLCGNQDIASLNPRTLTAAAFEIVYYGGMAAG